MSFANTGIKHAAIAMADVGVRSVYAGLCTLRGLGLRIGTGMHGEDLAMLMKDILISNKGLFGDCLGKAVAKAASTSRDYKALGACFVLSSLSRPKPPQE